MTSLPALGTGAVAGGGVGCDVGGGDGLYGTGCDGPYGTGCTGCGFCAYAGDVTVARCVPANNMKATEALHILPPRLKDLRAAADARREPRREPAILQRLERRE